MCVSFGVRVATFTTRTMHSCAPYIGITGSLPACVYFFLLYLNTTLPVALAALGFSASSLLCAFAPPPGLGFRDRGLRFIPSVLGFAIVALGIGTCFLSSILFRGNAPAAYGRVCAVVVTKVRNY